ncbi:hypothetical protein BDN67DRAFT_132710 [Paxillus ammoniavirescens]|nr:hypothetical protein BDN67DRAFT_132710 [Paxillus ammoniavirescens]
MLKTGPVASKVSPTCQKRNYNLKNGATTSKTALLPLNGRSRLKTDAAVSKLDPTCRKRTQRLEGEPDVSKMDPLPRK